jgi:cytosine/uracil/thiamine/allantoin permease
MCWYSCLEFHQDWVQKLRQLTDIKTILVRMYLMDLMQWMTEEQEVESRASDRKGR